MPAEGQGFLRSLSQLFVYIVRSVQHIVECSVCNVHCAVHSCSVQCAVCSVKFALLSVFVHCACAVCSV